METSIIATLTTLGKCFWSFLLLETDFNHLPKCILSHEVVDPRCMDVPRNNLNREKTIDVTIDEM